MTVTVAGLRSEGLLTAPSLDPRRRWATRAAARCLGSTSKDERRAGLVAANLLDTVPAEPVLVDPVLVDPVLVEPTREVAVYASH